MLSLNCIFVELLSVSNTVQLFLKGCVDIYRWSSVGPQFSGTKAVVDFRHGLVEPC